MDGSPSYRRNAPKPLSFFDDEAEEAAGGDDPGVPPVQEDAIIEARVSGLPRIVLSGGFSWARGPHDTCNYVLPRQLLAGSYPGSKREPEHTLKIRACLAVGVDSFLCLQPWEELARRFVPYASVAKRLMEEDEELARTRSQALGVPREKGAKALEFLHLPMPDGGVTEDEKLRTALGVIVEKIQKGRILYVHCWGGHGRTGTLICGLLVAYYGLTTRQAQEYYMQAHTQRSSPRAAGYWPHSQEQWDQVERMKGQAEEGCLRDSADAESSAQIPNLLDWKIRRDEEDGNEAG